MKQLTAITKNTLTLLRMNIVLCFMVVLLLKPVCTTNETELNLTELNFTKWNKNVTIVSSTEYHPRGMVPFYNLTHQILKLFIEEKPIPNGYISVSKNVIKPGPKVQSNEWGDLIKQYWAILLVVILTALLVGLMPIIGLCFCCCRCAGACGGRSQPFDKKHDTCRRVFLGFLLICAATGILFGVIIAFVTNSYMQEGIEDSTTSARNSARDTKEFLKTTSEHIDHLLVKNYDELSQHLINLLEETSVVVINNLEQKSKAISFTYLSEFVTKLPHIKDSLIRMRTITNELRVNASQLNDGLRGVKRELLVSLTKCTTKACKDVLSKYEIGKLDANGIDYNQLPDVTDIIESVDILLETKIDQDISEGKGVLENIRSKIISSIKKNIPRIQNAIAQVGKAIKNVSNKISSVMNGISSFVDTNAEKGTTTAEYYIKEYGKYRFYAGIGISSVLFLVLMCLTCALFCGICGKRPDGYGDDCCNKGSGARFLLLAVTIIFLTISVLAIIALAHFLIGLILQRGVCIPLRNPEGDQIFDYVDKFIDINSFIPNKKENENLKIYDHKVSEVIISCKKNNSIYEVLKLYREFNVSDIESYPSRYKIDESLESLLNEVKLDNEGQILSEAAETKIKQLAESALKNFDADKFSENLNDAITKYSLREIAQKLKDTASQIPNSDKEMTEVKVNLKNQALHLETYQDNLVQPMTDQSKELWNLAKELQKNLSYNGLPFEESVEKLLKEVRAAQDFIKTNGSDYIKETGHKLINHMKMEIENYIKYVVKSVQKDVGYCEPLAKVYDSLLVASCNKFVDPLNGFWAGVGWCILIFLPTLVISVKLSSLYQKSDPYPGPLVESDYMYDAYSERDNIPLANGPKPNKRRKAKNRRRRSRDRRGDYYEDSGSSHGGAVGIDARYNDMAPKHWDGGPPRYTNPPMAPPSSEYERPPPYYYPGTPAEQE